MIKEEDKIDTIEAAFPIAGDLRDFGGKDMDPKWTLLKQSTSNEDSQKDGLSLELFGGFSADGKHKAQKAIVEFLCDKTREGDENLYNPEDKYQTTPDKREEDGEKKGEDGDKKEEDGDKKDGDADDKSPSLEYVRYDTSDTAIDVLRLKWRTKYACEGSKEDQDSETSAHWGFFTWFILMYVHIHPEPISLLTDCSAFLSTATYLIFGSWLNYNRYGARGWDLLPHGDAIRDVPYLMKDWSRKVMSSVSGGGSRGGYAAV